MIFFHRHKTEHACLYLAITATNVRHLRTNFVTSEFAIRSQFSTSMLRTHGIAIWFVVVAIIIKFIFEELITDDVFINKNKNNTIAQNGYLLRFAATKSHLDHVHSYLIATKIREIVNKPIAFL